MMSDDEIDALVKQLDFAMPTVHMTLLASRAIRELRARRDELQRSIDAIALGVA